MSGDGSSQQHVSSAPVGFLELFYDLVFVAATMVLSNSFSHHVGWGQGAITALMFLLLWFLWFHSTVLMNAERLDDTLQRGLVFAQMLLIFLAAVAFADRAANTVDLVGFIYPGAVLVVAVGYNRLRTADEPLRTWAIARRNRLVLSAAAMLLGVVAPNTFHWFPYAVAILLLAIPTRVRLPVARGSVTPGFDEHHLTERAALLTLIVLGEALVKAALVITGGTLGAWDTVTLVVLFVILFGLYSAYFDDVPEAGIRPGIVFGELWLLAHAVLQLSIVGLAIGISKYLQVGSERAPDEAIVISMVSYAGIFVGLSLIAAFDRRVPRGALLTTRLVTVVLAIGLAFLPLHWRSIVPGTYLLELAVLSIGNAVICWRIRERTTIAPPDSPLFVHHRHHPEVPDEL